MTSLEQRLPRAAYRARDWHERELETLFARAWAFAGVTSDFARTGDYRTAQAGAFPIAVVRGNDGALAAFHNICRHRGILLLEGDGNAGARLVCPYHRWTYDLMGGLRGAPNMASCFPGLDRAAQSLRPAALGVFGDLVFVSPDPEADFKSWIAPIAGVAWPHDLAAADLREGPPLIYDMKCDWKVFVENALDGYHLAYLHKHTLGGPVPSENLWQRHGDHAIWYATDGEEGVRHALPAKARRQYEESGATMVRDAEGPGYGGVYHLFPTTLIVATPYDFSISSLQPTAPGCCRMTVRHWAGPGQEADERKRIAGYDPGTGIISSDNWTTHPLETGDFQTEDVWICEKIQRGLASPAFRPGPLALGTGAEEPIAWFQATVLREVLPG